MTKKKSLPVAEDMMTSAAKAIGSTLGKLAVAAGLEHGAAPTSTMAPGRKKIVRKSAVKTPAKKSVPTKKTAMVKKSVGRPAPKKKRAK